MASRDAEHGRCRLELAEGTVRPGDVVVPQVLGQHLSQVLLVGDQQVFAERWTPIILRNMMLGCTGFCEILDGAPGLPRSVLSARLRSLQQDGVVRRDQDGRATSYHLTESGRELAAICTSLGVWGTRWREAPPGHRDPALMLWGLARLIDPGSLPRPRVVARFDITGRPAQPLLARRVTVRQRGVRAPARI
jgi:DNA-binding HxlR family transcriptional regulator